MKLQCCGACVHMQGTKLFQYSTCPRGWVTYNFHSSCKHMHLSFKSLCNKEEHKGVICNKTSSNSSQSTRPVGRVLWEELLVLSRFHSHLQADEWNFCPLIWQVAWLTVLKYFMPDCLKASEISTVVTTADTGCPFPIGFPIVTMSGTTSGIACKKCHYSKTCAKQPLKTTHNKDLNDKW